MIFAPAPGAFLRWVALTGAVLTLALAAGLLLPGTAGAQGSDRDEVRYQGKHDVRVVPVNYNLGGGFGAVFGLCDAPGYGGGGAGCAGDYGY